MRRILLLGPIALLSGLMVEIGWANAQPSADVEGVRGASNAFYEALAVLDDGSAMAKVWVKEPFVTYASPSSKSFVMGWDAMKKVWSGNDRYAKRDVSVTVRMPKSTLLGRLRGRWGMKPDRLR